MKTIRLHEATPPLGPPPASRWQFGRLLTAPHRLGFAAGAALLATSALWWAAVLAARKIGVELPWAVAPLLAHGLLMALGFMPLFMTGFLFTAGPRWLDVPPVSATALRNPVLLMLAGWALALPGFHLAAGLAAAGIAALALGWSWLVLRFVSLLRASRAPDKLHARLVASAAAIGALAMLWAAVAIGAGHAGALRAATQCALWGFLAPVFASVSHRMLPFFTASALPTMDAWRPNTLLWAMLAAIATELAFAVAELGWWPLPAAARWLQVAIELPAALLLLWLALRWGLVQSLKVRLLAMLHIGFLWLGIAFALGAVSHALMAASGGEHSLGLAPLHALTMGYLGSTLLAMATRVAAGHSGRPLAADNIAWTLFWTLQCAVLLRLAHALWPAAGAVLLLAAVGAWAVAMVGWALRYGNWLGRPRSDGRPG